MCRGPIKPTPHALSRSPKAFIFRHGQGVRLSPLCVAAPTLRNQLAERYPDIKASGYCEGALRRVFWAVATEP